MREKSYKDNYNSQPNKYRGGETKVMKKILNLALVFALLLTMVTPAFAASTTEELGKYEDAVTRLASLGVLTGEGDGSFNVDDTITRAEFTAMAVRVLGMEEAAKVSAGATPFKDGVAPWASGYVNVAVNQGIVTGYADGRFGEKDAVTQAQVLAMLVRALGYDPQVSKEGWPTNYIVKAIDLGLTEGVDNVSAYAPAKRGDVFQMADNALTVKKLKQVKFGDTAEYEVSDETLLSENLGAKKVEGQVTAIPRTSTALDDNEIRIENTVYQLAGSVDFEEAYLAEVTAYVNKDKKVIDLNIDSEIEYDAVDYVAADEELTLIGADKTYEVDFGADNFSYDYAKVIFADDEPETVYGFNWDDNLIVESVEDEIVYTYNDEELDVEDYTLVKDGKTISSDDLKDGDILFYDETAEYAVVYNNSVVGEVEEVYTDSFELNGDKYTIVTDYTRYLSDDSVDFATADDVEAMMEEGAVELFFDHAGNLVLIKGDLGEAATSSFVALLIAPSTDYDSRGKTYFTFDVFTEKGEVVKYDLSESFVDDYDGNDDTDFTTWQTDFNDPTDADPGNYAAKTTLVKITVDEDGDLTAISKLTESGLTVDNNANKLATDASYQGTFKMASEVVVFNVQNYTTDTKDIKIEKLADVEYDYIFGGTTFVSSTGYVTYILATSTDVDDATTPYTGIVTDVRKTTASTDTWKITMLVNNESVTYYTDGVVNASGVAKKEVIKVDVNNITNKITNLTNYTDAGDANARVEVVVVDSRSVADKTITVGSDVYRLVSDAYVYDVTGTSVKQISLRDLNQDDSVTLYLGADDSVFVKYVVRTAVAGTTPPPAPTTATVTASHAAGQLTVDVDNLASAFAVRVFDRDSGAAIGGYTTLDSNGVGTITVADNPVFITVKVYDNTGKEILVKDVVVQ